jgi:hypothetical protein
MHNTTYEFQSSSTINAVFGAFQSTVLANFGTSEYSIDVIKSTQNRRSPRVIDGTVYYTARTSTTETYRLCDLGQPQQWTLTNPATTCTAIQTGIPHCSIQNELIRSSTENKEFANQTSRTATDIEIVSCDVTDGVLAIISGTSSSVRGFVNTLGDGFILTKNEITVDAPQDDDVDIVEIIAIAGGVFIAVIIVVMSIHHNPPGKDMHEPPAGNFLTVPGLNGDLIF